MTQHPEFDATAILTIPKPYKGADAEQGLLIYNRPDLFKLIRDKEGVDVHVSRGVDSIDAEAGTVSAVVRPAYDGHLGGGVILTRIGERSLSDYGVARSYGPPVDTDRYVENLNPMSLRVLARDKYRVAKEVLRPLGLYRDNILVKPEQASEIAESDVAIASQLIMKPNGGFASRDIVAGTPLEVYRQLSGIAEPKIIEERLNFKIPLPSIKGRDDYEQARLDEANEKGVNKELRLYSYGDTVWYPVARVAEPGSLRLTGDEWVYLDEDTVPIDAILAANRVKRVLDMKTGKTDTLLAVDLVYVTSESRPEPHWEVMEVNAEPYIMRPENNKSVGVKHQRLLAAQIGRIARNSKS